MAFWPIMILMKIALKELAEIYQEEKELLQLYLRILEDEQRSISSQNWPRAEKLLDEINDVAGKALALEQRRQICLERIEEMERTSESRGATQTLARELDSQGARMLEGLREAAGQASRDIYLLRIRVDTMISQSLELILPFLSIPKGPGQIKSRTINSISEGISVSSHA